MACDTAWSEFGPATLARKIAERIPQLRGAVERRTVRCIPPERILSSLLPQFAGLLRGIFNEEYVFAAADELLAVALRRRRLEGAKVLVNYQGNGGSYLRTAKSMGMRILTDFIITPDNLEIVKRERESWPDWEGKPPPPHAISFYRRRIDKLLQISDKYLCPSTRVADDLAKFPSFRPDRVRILPYGANLVSLKQRRPVAGRVLFVGAASLRKGIPYLAEAARIVHREFPTAEFVVAGDVTEAVRRQTLDAGLTYLGKLSGSQLAAEYAAASIFCLPTLAEGSPSAIFEALAYGIPVVTTYAAGSVVVDEHDGLIVPERDARALADGLLRILGDSALQERLSIAAASTSQQWSEQNCARGFLDIIEQEIENMKQSAT